MSAAVETLRTWLLANWPYLVAGAWMVFEWWLARTDKVKAGSTIALVADMLRVLLGRVPAVGKALAVIGSHLPPVTSSPQSPAPPPASSSR